ncbi:hypothetical protein HOU02_gp157 [Caulobacter phage CcrBL9]|uniref:Uncharacterized protein n=1 Tax=Caulobacter phage CcrBL9 TaxID=2283270 RepID=A0A385EFL7_9CAUD|nr:hypothetical protein HOU02_gp028 [Caulobacter phage CcrBL9]YP_009810198.1 hypothetical protein HOU02_gp157 [Caulobacter phage CcrBL9]AXQ69052.1 hypothetical protein CcrBL9_gp028 [Caulobacter phage CcrBL9]AXQ69568.1 hypothetical protein CcrBL9_gp544 [Caulobacter phage CcrBL9]
MTAQAVLTARLDRAVAVISGDIPKSRRKVRKARRAFQRALEGMDIPTYVAWINHPDSFIALTDDVEHWAQSGITTAAQLGAYLDGCARHEARKDLMSGYLDD